MSVLLYLAFNGLRKIVKPLLVLRFGSDGVECAQGRLSWQELKQVSIVQFTILSEHGNPKQSTWVRFNLQPGKKVRPPIFSYYDCGGVLVSLAEQSEIGLELPPWVWVEHVFPTVRVFYSGPIGHVFEDERELGFRPRRLAKVEFKAHGFRLL